MGAGVFSATTPMSNTLHQLFLYFCCLVFFPFFKSVLFYCCIVRSEKAAACLLPNTCLGIATRIIAKFESIEVGLTWDRVSASPSPDDDFSFSWVLGMLIIQSLIFAIITWCVILISLIWAYENVFPSVLHIIRNIYYYYSTLNKFTQFWLVESSTNNNNIEWCIWNKSYVNCGYEIKWRMILAVMIAIFTIA